jgi:hypothetical protein
LEVHEDVIEFLPGDYVCGDCGQPTVPMTNGFEEFEYIDLIERSFLLKRTKRQKYMKTSECPNPIIVAPKPPEPETLGGRYGLVFYVLVALSKYVDHQPLNRQTQQMARIGLKVTSQSLFNCQWLVCNRASTTYEAIQTEKGRRLLARTVGEAEVVCRPPRGPDVEQRRRTRAEMRGHRSQQFQGLAQQTGRARRGHDVHDLRNGPYPRHRSRQVPRSGPSARSTRG